MSENPEKYGIKQEEDNGDESDDSDEEAVIQLDRADILVFLAALGLVIPRMKMRAPYRRLQLPITHTRRNISIALVAE